jgi:hypothetical protein
MRGLQGLPLLLITPLLTGHFIFFTGLTAKIIEFCVLKWRYQNFIEKNLSLLLTGLQGNTSRLVNGL